MVEDKERPVAVQHMHSHSSGTAGSGEPLHGARVEAVSSGDGRPGAPAPGPGGKPRYGRPHGSKPGGGKPGGGKPGGGKPDGKPGGGKRLPPAVFAEAKRLEAANGLPFAIAVKVATGKLSMKDALAEMLLHEKISKLVADKYLMLKYATLVIQGRLTLDKALLLSKVAYRKASEDYMKCHFDDFAENGRSLFAALVSKRTVTGKVQASERWDVVFAGPDGEEQRIQKHDVKFYFDIEHKKGVLKHLEWGPKGTVVEPGFLSDRKKRQDVPVAAIMSSQSVGKHVKVVGIEGDVIKGAVHWIGRWELVLDLGGSVLVVIPRHAISSVH